MQEKKPNYLLIAGFSLQAIFVIALIASLPKIFQGPKISPDNRDAQPSVTIIDLEKNIQTLSPNFAKEVENQLFLIVQDNNIDIDFGTALAYIRENSLNHIHFEDEKFDFYNFIVDIASLSQSYQLFLTVSAVENNQYIDPNGTIIPLCLSDAEPKIYPDFKCKDMYGQETRNSIVFNYLPYFNNNKYLFIPKLSNYNYLMVMADRSDDDLEWPNDIISEVKNDIRLLGVSPDLFTYGVDGFREN